MSIFILNLKYILTVEWKQLSVIISNNLRKVHIGSEEHNRNFLELRLCDKWERYAIYGTWNEIMKNCCLYAKEVKVYNGMDTEEIYTDVEMPKFNLMDIDRLKKFLILL